MKLTALAAIFAIISLTFCGCISRGAYHFAGTTLPESQRKIALNEFINATSEARLTPLLKNALSEKLENTPSIDVVSEEHAGLLVALKLESLDQRSTARAQMRDTADRKDDGDAYQSVLFRIELKVSYIARSTDNSGAEYKGVVTATADVPMMPDHETALQTALRQVAIDAALKLASAITER
jgi:hypothetical protein